ncbi:helix-turn-helix domain-containing protein [Allorhodopirellula heiligendammensis]|uniref:Helix-turn-helix domain protein n=1 Tax=Allorhodopirellula heiligendammensis TaxID=2714739 RepID=A0A5C6C990_9BACT|nr:helix-turn-helix domain-containing protein [Allorhodopirellula heiligendammensis]TWU20011.1 Helix-turn-helix domain protein [Allorhodopirellula heiligendammensis]
MANYLSLEEAATKLGIPTQKLIDLRSQGQVRGFRDGTSWKFPENEIDRLKDDLPNLSGIGSGIGSGTGSGTQGGGVMADDSALSLGGVIGDDDAGSSLELGSEPSGRGGDSDVNLVPGDGSDGSDVLVIPSAGGSGILDLDDLDIAGSAISHNSGELNLGPDEGGSKTGDLGAEAAGATPAGKPQQPAAASEDSDEFNLGSVLDLEEDIVPGSDQDLDLRLDDQDERASDLEMLSGLDSGKSEQPQPRASGDVLSELDLLGGDSVGSGVLGSDSDALVVGPLSGLSDTGSGVDDALADDDLMISDDDDDLIISGEGNDISMAGDSGIDLMSPSDSGLSLESEPLDLASSSVSSLDLGAELNDGSGSGVGSSGYGSGLIPADDSGSDIDFPADEEFQLSPSGIQLDKSDESESQEIDVENSDSFAGDFDDPAFEEAGAFEEVDAFDDAGAAAVDEVGGFDDHGADVMEEDEVAQSAGAPVGAPTGFEIPFTLLQTVGLLLILLVMSLGGMLMTDLIRNMWSYSEPAAPVSSLTDWLIDVAGWGR